MLTTVYLKDDCALLCVYNFSNKKEKFKLDINGELLGFDIKNAKNIRLGSNIKMSADVTNELVLGGRKGKIFLISG